MPSGQRGATPPCPSLVARARAGVPLAASAAALVAAVATSGSGCIFIAAVDADLLADAGADAPGQGGGGAGGGGGAAGGCDGDAMWDDGNPCTLDHCVERACVFDAQPVGAACADADACNGAESCDAEAHCLPGAPLATDDADPCTTDACDPASGDVSHAPIPSCLGWEPLPTAGAPLARWSHSAVWTGTKMIVWGGQTSSAEVTATGGLYDPAARTWTATSTAGAPTARHSHRAVWTGTRMIVWGGFGDSSLASGGGAYDPATDTWTPVTATGEPPLRVGHTAVWSGARMIVWGGLSGASPLGTGGLYDPAADAWTSLSTAGLAPTARFGHSAIWTGDRMIVWGGQNTFDWLDTGALLDPAGAANGVWTAATSATNAPYRREGHAAVWTGSTMIVWGGWTGGPFLDTGAIFDPAAGANGSWTATTTTGAPAARRDPVAVWTGSTMLVWGGYAGENGTTLFGDGGRLTPDAGGGAWTPIPAVSTLAPRRDATGVWTGSAVIVWGGRLDATTATASGAVGVP